MKADVIYCDPPWEYNDRAAWSDSKSGGGATGHYNVADAGGMAAWSSQFHAMRPGDDVKPATHRPKSAPSGAMLMWVTGPHHMNAHPLMKAWGYESVKPIWYWVKTTKNGKIFKGGGHYTFSNIEYVLLGQANTKKPLMPVISRGRAKEEIHRAPHPRIMKFDAKTGRRRSIIEHSRKPDFFRDMCMELFGLEDPETGDERRYCEVFARQRHAGWSAIGDQLEGGEAIQAGRVITPLPPPDRPQDRSVIITPQMRQMSLFS